MTISITSPPKSNYKSDKFSCNTCGVGDGGAVSIGESEVAFVANLCKAKEPSRCCFEIVDSRSRNSNSNPEGSNEYPPKC